MLLDLAVLFLFVFAALPVVTTSVVTVTKGKTSFGLSTVDSEFWSWEVEDILD